MGIATDYIDRLQVMVGRRIPWDRDYEQISRFAMPMSDSFRRMDARATSGGMSSMVGKLNDWTAGPTSTFYTKEIFDTTALWGLERMSTGIESLVTPANDKWHGLTTDDPFGVEPNDVEKRWYEYLRDYLFRARYNPASGFQLANQSALKSCCAYGTGILYGEEGYMKNGKDATRLPFRYRWFPLSECYLADNDEAETDTNYRLFQWTPRQVIQRFGTEMAGSKIVAEANDPMKKDVPIEILHAVEPREETGSYGNTMRRSDWTSCYIDVRGKRLISESGYFSFPYIVYHWTKRADCPYGEGPMMLALAEVKSLNLLAKNALRAAQQQTRPPIGTADDATMNRPDLNAGAINYNAVDAQGRLKIQPIITSQPSQFVATILEASRNQVREALYVNLWQILINNPKMTATEVMQRAAEKGELLGPVGGRVQSALAKCIERELDMLERKGAFYPGSPLQPPGTLAEKNIGARFTSPLDRLRRMPELVGSQQVIEIATALQAVDRGSADVVDGDAILRNAQEVTGAKADIIRSDDEVQEIRDQRNAMEQAASAAQIGKDGAKALKDGAPAMGAVRQQLADIGVTA